MWLPGGSKHVLLEVLWRHLRWRLTVRGWRDIVRLQHESEDKLHTIAGHAMTPLQRGCQSWRLQDDLSCSTPTLLGNTLFLAGVKITMTHHLSKL